VKAKASKAKAKASAKASAKKEDAKLKRGAAAKAAAKAATAIREEVLAKAVAAKAGANAATDAPPKAKAGAKAATGAPPPPKAKAGTEAAKAAPPVQKAKGGAKAATGAPPQPKAAKAGAKAAAVAPPQPKAAKAGAKAAAVAPPPPKAKAGAKAAAVAAPPPKAKAGTEAAAVATPPPNAIATKKEAICEKCGLYKEFERLKCASKKGDPVFKCKSCLSKQATMSKLRIRLPWGAGAELSDEECRAFWRDTPGDKKSLQAAVHKVSKKVTANLEYTGTEGEYKPEPFWLQQGYSSEFLAKRPRKEEDGMILVHVCTYKDGTRASETQERESNLAALFKRQRLEDGKVVDVDGDSSSSSSSSSRDITLRAADEGKP